MKDPIFNRRKAPQGGQSAKDTPPPACFAAGDKAEGFAADAADDAKRSVGGIKRDADSGKRDADSGKCNPDSGKHGGSGGVPPVCSAMGDAGRSGRRVTLASLVLNCLLGLGKTSIGYFANSSALIADGLNSLSDLSTDIAALFGITMANKPEDDNHHYGHHKFASLVSLFIACMVLLVCIGLIISSAWALFHAEPVILGWLPFSVAAVSMVAKGLIHRKTQAVAVRTGSRILAANALNQRTDAFSSALVLIALLAVGVGGQGFAFVDKGLGIVMGVWFGIAVIKILREALDDLLDAAPEKAMLDDIREHILPVEGALSYHKFRSRRVGDRFEVDMHLQVEPTLTVDEGHAIASAVRNDILRQHPEVVSVLIHVEPAKGRHLKDKGISDREGS